MQGRPVPGYRLAEREALERVEVVWAPLLDDDGKTMTGPCLCMSADRIWGVGFTLTDPGLNICFTDSAYQRRGSGNMMMEWGCKLADHLSLPT